MRFLQLFTITALVVCFVTTLEGQSKSNKTKQKINKAVSSVGIQKRFSVGLNHYPLTYNLLETPAGDVIGVWNQFGNWLQNQTNVNLIIKDTVNVGRKIPHVSFGYVYVGDWIDVGLEAMTGHFKMISIAGQFQGLIRPYGVLGEFGYEADSDFLDYLYRTGVVGYTIGYDSSVPVLLIVGKQMKNQYQQINFGLTFDFPLGDNTIQAKGLYNWDFKKPDNGGFRQSGWQVKLQYVFK